jgi:biopolymer transport protein ExbB/TolQ
MIVEHLLRVARLGSTWVLYLLLALSVISIGVIVDRWLYFRRLRDPGRGLRDRIAKALQRGDLSEAERLLASSKTVEARVVAQALAWRHGGPRAVADALDSELAVARAEIERGLNFLGTIGNNAPFIGLLGTVLGVIEAFHQLSAGANKAAMGNVMSGIAEALVATGVGLFVALPAVVAYNIAQKRIAGIEDATSGLGKLVTAYLEGAPVPARSITAAVETKQQPAETSATSTRDAVLAIAIVAGGE